MPGPHRLIESVIKRVAHNTNDLEPIIAFGDGHCRRRFRLHLGHANLVAQRVAHGGKASRHGLVDDRHSGSALGFRFVPEPALKQWNLQHSEILLADPIHERMSGTARSQTLF